MKRWTYRSPEEREKIFLKINELINKGYTRTLACASYNISSSVYHTWVYAAKKGSLNGTIKNSNQLKKERLMQNQNSNKILRVFLNVNLSAGHQKLTEVAKEAGIKTSEIGKGEYVIFINCARDKIKLYAASETIAYHKLARGRKIDMRVIRELPSVFNGKEINYDLALKKVVEEALAKKTKTIQVV